MSEKISNASRSGRVQNRVGRGAASALRAHTPKHTLPKRQGADPERHTDILEHAVPSCLTDARGVATIIQRGHDGEASLRRCQRAKQLMGVALSTNARCRYLLKTLTPSPPTP